MLKRTKIEISDLAKHECKQADLVALTSMYFRYARFGDEMVCQLLEEVITHLDRDVRNFEIVERSKKTHDTNRKLR